MRDGIFGDHEGAARIDLVHQIEALHIGLGKLGERNRARVVDDDVERAEARRRLADRALDRGLVAPAAGEEMLPSRWGCGVSVLAAIAILAPSRAARSAIASPMPREAPVMKRVLPLSDIDVTACVQRMLRRQPSPPANAGAR